MAKRAVGVLQVLHLVGKTGGSLPFTSGPLRGDLGEMPESMLGVQELEAVLAGCDRAGGIAEPSALAPGLREQG